MKTRYVAVDREDMAEVRRLVQTVDDGEDDSVEALVRHLKEMEVLKMEAAVAVEIETGTMVLRAREPRHRFGVRPSKTDR